MNGQRLICSRLVGAVTRRMANGGRVVALIAALAVSGCAAMGGSAVEPASVASAPQGWRNAPVAAQETAWPDPAWWQGFGSAELVRLIESAERNNHDLAAAGHRIGQARANLQVAGGHAGRRRQRQLAEAVGIERRLPRCRGASRPDL